MTSHQERANAIRALAMDAVQKANSGHPGAPMGMADIAEVLWTRHLKHNPANPAWHNRDRFVLSNGHGSMLIYSLLHLTGYDLSMEDLRNFRQLGSRTPGHPEYGYTPGVETTTGPLGQGLANAVGLAIAEKVLADHFNRDGLSLVDHHTWVFAGDGCLMEGISHEVCSLAGTLGLGKLICFYDDNGISIDGKVENWFTDDTPARFRSYGWQVIDNVDGHDAAAIDGAIANAKATADKPTLICCKTMIGFGAPNKEGTSGVHGSPLGADEVKATRKNLNWPYEPFVVPEEIYADWDCRKAGAEAESQWSGLWQTYESRHPGLAAEFERRMAAELPSDFDEFMDGLLRQAQVAGAKVATRQASGSVIASLAAKLPELLGGSADLTGSNLTNWPGMTPVSAGAGGNYIYYGVREFGMTAIGNGIALHGGLIPFSGTFLIFMEYARNAVRMAALMKQRNILVYTHDSIGQGEDGPTHQPVEQLANLRGTPNMSVWRPADSVETVAAWHSAITRTQGPTALVFSRQGLPCLSRSDEQLKAISKGGYVIRDCDGEPDLIMIATGSEVSLACAAQEELAAEGVKVRVVSMPSVDQFEAQSAEYRESVLPNRIRRRLAIEAAHAGYWSRFTGLDGRVVGMTSFGESGPGDEVLRHFGFSIENVVSVAKEML